MTKHLGVLAAICATGLWSLKPIYVSLIKDTLTAPEIFFCAGALSLVASLIGFFYLKNDVLKVFTSKVFKSTLVKCALAGALLSVWYIAFYKALSGQAPAQATIISFTWPFFAILAMRIFAPHLQRSLLKREYPFLALAFLGAAITATGGGGSSSLVIFALIAAVASGFYLPFLSLALEDIGEVIGNRLRASFLVVSLANAFSFLIATPILVLTGVDVVPDHIPDISTLLVLGAIGIGTYIIAELVWCWAICTARTPTLTALPYLSPAVSVLLLALLTKADPPAQSIVGLVLILGANLALHFKIAKKTQMPPPTPIGAGDVLETIEETQKSA